MRQHTTQAVTLIGSLKTCLRCSLAPTQDDTQKHTRANASHVSCVEREGADAGKCVVVSVGRGTSGARNAEGNSLHYLLHLCCGVDRRFPAPARPSAPRVVSLPDCHIAVCDPWSVSESSATTGLVPQIRPRRSCSRRLLSAPRGGRGEHCGVGWWWWTSFCQSITGGRKW